MFHVLTVHYLDDRWIEPQLRYLERNVDDFKVYASLNGVDPKWSDRFFFAEDLQGSHPEKLNALAEIARDHAAPGDLFLFLDGDAFPIAPVTPAILGGLPLAAVRRDENLGARQPHPCFCVTPVDFWFELEGDWRRGYTWTASNGEQITDAGGNLLGLLVEQGIEWRPLLRSNVWDLDPLWFAVYGNVVYHHGAGFRPPVSARVGRPSHDAVVTATAAARTPASIPVLGRLERSVRYRRAQRRENRRLAQVTEDAQRLSDEVFDWIRTDDEFFLRFTDPDRARAQPRVPKS